jgi:hypothetical protein
VCGAHLLSAEGRAENTFADGLADERMGAHGLVNHLGTERLDVVGAHQPPRRRLGERDVEQRLVAVTLDDLGGSTRRPDRLTDAAHRTAVRGVRVKELAPGGDDPRGIAPHRRHICEEDVVAGPNDDRPEQVDVGFAHHHEGRLLGGNRVGQEWDRARQERVVTGVEHRLVSKRGDDDGRRIKLGWGHPS